MGPLPAARANAWEGIGKGAALSFVGTVGMDVGSAEGGDWVGSAPESVLWVPSGFRDPEGQPKDTYHGSL